MFENLSLPHLLMVVFIAMMLFGAKRIPEIAGSMGKGIKEFKKNMSDGALDDGDAFASRRDGRTTERGVSSDRMDEGRSEPKRLL